MIKKVKTTVLSVFKNFEIAGISLLFIWISFFPAPVQAKYAHILRIFLFLSFILIFLRERKSLFKKQDVFLFLFIFSFFINIFYSIYATAALKTYLNIALPMFFIYYLCAIGFQSKKNFLFFSKLVCVSSILVSLLAVVEIVFKFNPIYEFLLNNPYYQRYTIGFVRPVSTQFNPAPLGTYLLASIPFNFIVFKNSLKMKWIGFFGILLNSVILLLTFSRGVFIGFIFMILIFLLFRKRFKLAAVFLIILTFLSLSASFLPYPVNRFGANFLFGGKNRGVISQYRVDRCKMTADIIKKYPLTGIGFTHFRKRFKEFYPHKNKPGYEFMIADNMYLTILAETGAIGFLGFFLFFISTLKKCLKYLKEKDSLLKENLFIFMIFLAIAAILINMAAYELFYWPNQYLFLCILIGSVEAVNRSMGK